MGLSVVFSKLYLTVTRLLIKHDKVGKLCEPENDEKFTIKNLRIL